MSIGASIVQGAAQGQLIGTALATSRNLRDWQIAYNKLANRYNELSDKFDKLVGLYENVRERRDEYAVMIEELNRELGNANSSMYSIAADRTKAYDYIVELTKVIRETDPENKVLHNPNSILADVNFYSAERLREASRRIQNEIANNTTSAFSANKNKNKIDDEVNKRVDRASSYKEDADKGILELNPSVTPRV